MEFNLEGIDLTSDTASTEIIARVDAHVLGLKNKNNDLIKRESDAKESVEKLTLEIATTEENNKVALAEKDNDVAKYKLAVEERDEKIKTVQLEFKETNNKRLLESAVNDFSSVLADDPAGRMYMQSQFNGLVEVKDGVVVPKDVTTKLEDLKQSLITDKANAKYIKANVGSGTGSVGSENGFSSVKSLKDMTATEEALLANSDPALYNSLLTK
jgi:hypothetical protein